jgi:uncharacterized protein YcbK (DUF882 family)
MKQRAGMRGVRAVAAAAMALMLAPPAGRAQVAGAERVASSGAAAAGTVMTAAASASTPSKKDAYLASKSSAGVGKRKALAARPGKPPPVVVSIYNTWTHEWLVIDRDRRAALPPAEQVDRFLRCHFTNQTTDMRPELIKTLREAAEHFSARRIDIVSGYRSPKYNLMLRKKGHEVARDSQHTQGHAVDFRIPGVDVRALEAWALARRAGGVGLYLESKFIHVDTGPVRRWDGT